MNDLDLLRGLMPAAPLLTLPELSPAREAVAAGIAEAVAAGSATVKEPGRHACPRPASGRRPGKRHGPARLAVMSAVTAGAAAALVAGVVVGTHSSPHRAPQAARPPGMTPPVLAAHLTAKQVLARAAAAALAEPAVIPRADQFVYTEVNDGTGEVVRTWLSVDGKQNGLETTTASDGKVQSFVIPGCATGVHRDRTPGIGGRPLHLGQPMTIQQYRQKYGMNPPMDGPVVTVPCTPEPAYFPAMPTSAAAMLGYLEQTQGISPANLNDLAKTVGSILQSDYILPAQRAALYGFLAGTPGLVVEHDVRDVTGRPGVGVGWSFEGSRAMNIFDPASYAYLGLSTWGEQGRQGGDALLQIAVVNHPGQLP